MNKEKLEIFKTYLKETNIPILIENIDVLFFKDVISLEANSDLSLLNGHYEGIDFVAPSWYQELVKKVMPILIINNINNIPIDVQSKFIEILKYKKISTFDLPKNTKIIIT